MKIPGLVNVLNGMTDIPFTEFAWSEAPGGSYGVVTLSGQEVLRADEDPVAEKMRTGYVDVFVKATDADPTDAVESAMKSIGLWFRMESIQFEPETGFMHFEWSWADTLGTALQALYVVRFHAHTGYVGDPQIIPAGSHPTLPSQQVSTYVEDGITWRPLSRWTPSTLDQVYENKVYEKVYETSVSIQGSYLKYRAYSPDGIRPFRADQIQKLIEAFNKHMSIVCSFNNGQVQMDAKAIDTEKITWNPYSEDAFAIWATE